METPLMEAEHDLLSAGGRVLKTVSSETERPKHQVQTGDVLQQVPLCLWSSADPLQRRRDSWHQKTTMTCGHGAWLFEFIRSSPQSIKVLL